MVTEAELGDSGSPMQVAEPSQQLGLSPGAAALDAAAGVLQQQQQLAAVAALQQGPSPSAATAEGPTALPAATPAPAGEAAADGAGLRERPISGAAAEWHHLLGAARQLLAEIQQADSSLGSFVRDPFLATAEEVEARYAEVVSGWPA